MKDIREIKGAIFDLDGTLLDSMNVWARVDDKVLERRGLPPDDEYKHAVKGMTFATAARYTIARYRLNENEENLIAEWSALVKDAYENEVLLKPYAKELLEALKQRGVKMAIATSSKPEFFLPCLKRNGALDYFSAYALTEETARGKDFPDVYLLAASRIGQRAEECAVFEDILMGVQGANKGGFLTAAVYDPLSLGDCELLKTHAGYYFHSLKECVDLLG